MGNGWRSHRAAWWLGAVMLVAGLYPHLLFSWQASELSYFKAAYDEDTYYVQALSGRTSIFYRWLSDHLMVALAAVGGLGHGKALALLDALLPPAVMLGAYTLAATVARGTAARVLLALALVFAPDLLSLGVSSVWDGRWTLDALRHALPNGLVLIPDYATSYLAVFRTPEPQLAWALLFLHWALVLRLLGRVEAGLPVGPVLGWGLLATCAALTFSYIFVALPAFLLLACLWLALLLRRAPRAPSLLLGVALALPVALVALYLVLHPMSATGASLVFASRLPAVAPSSAMALVLALCWGLWWVRVRRIDLPGLYAALAGALPLLLLNQQLVTGVMVSVRDWERYISYPLLVLSAAVLLRQVLAGQPPQRRWRWLCWIGVVYLVGVLVSALKTTYRQWEALNHESLAMARALAQLPAEHKGLPIVLAKVSVAPLLELRSGNPGPYPGAYGSLFVRPVPDLGARDLKAHLVALEQKRTLYEYLFRTDVTPQRLAQVLEAEASARSGYHLAFFFSFVDHWYPASDNRRVREADIRAAIPLIVSEYAALHREVPQAWRTPALLITDQAPGLSSAYDYRALASASSSRASVSAYLQTAKP